MCRHNHHVAVDYFAVGVIAYELMIGKRPYQGKSRKEIKEQMMAKQMGIKKTEVPHGWTCEAADFVSKVLLFVFPHDFPAFATERIVFAEEACKSVRSEWTSRN